MKRYKYKARDQEGKLVSGFKNALSQKEVADALNRENLIAVSIDEVRRAKKSKKAKSETSNTGKGKVSPQEVAIFCRQLTTMLGAGVSVAEAIEDLGKAENNQKFQNVLMQVVADVRSGLALTEAFSKHPSVFSDLFVHMLSSGEESGKLAQVLEDLAIYLEKSVKLKNQVKSAMMYPSFVGGFFLLVLFGLVFFMVPMFEDLFSSFGAELPGPTQITVNISNALISNLPIVVVLLVLAIVGIRAAYKTKGGRMFFDKLKISIPVFGPLILKVTMSRFFQTLSTLLKSGIDVIGSLDVAAKVSGSAPVEDIVMKVRTGIVEGSSLSEELEKYDIFPRLTVSMASAGEKSGALDDLLDKISDYYTDEVDADVAGLSSLIEPVMIVSLGLLVGVFVITMYLPIFQMAGVMAGG
ncbi:MAG: type II secretion system F family protein [Elusimicrobia bacterium]|nr:type II secretion system F family protein [Elusimicrobiota bacterium]